MPLPLVWLDDVDPNTDDRPPGTAHFVTWSPPHLSRHYRENVAQHRLPIVVFVPWRNGDPNYVDGCPFIIDSHPSNDPGASWTVNVDEDSLKAGEQPIITVAPSIAIGGIYHGFLRDGVLTDDIGH